MTPIERAIELLQEHEAESQGPRYRRRTKRRNPFGDKDTEVRLRTLEAMEEMVTLMRHITGPIPPTEFDVQLGMVNDALGGPFTAPKWPDPPPVSVPPAGNPTNPFTDDLAPRPRTPSECPKDGSVASSFEHDLSKLINRYSLENETNVPDFILASYLVRCLEAFRHTIQHTHNWYEGSEWLNPSGHTDASDRTEHKNRQKLYNRPQGPAMPKGSDI